MSPSNPQDNPYLLEVAGKAHEALERLIGQLLDAVPQEPQDEIDALRGIHQVLAYHLGTVGRLIEHRFQAEGDAEVTKRVLEERERCIKSGIEHADEHRAPYLD